jgi:hypothetical protein
MSVLPSLNQYSGACVGNESSTGGYAGHDPVWTSTQVYVMEEIQGTEHFVGICKHCNCVVVFPNRVRQR